MQTRLLESWVAGVMVIALGYTLYAICYPQSGYCFEICLIWDMHEYMYFIAGFVIMSIELSNTCTKLDVHLFLILSVFYLSMSVSIYVWVIFVSPVYLTLSSCLSVSFISFLFLFLPHCYLFLPHLFFPYKIVLLVY